MAEDKFTCAACGKDYEHASSVTECKMCHRTHCTECLSEEGICKPCDAEGK